jgi:hypothetical protein
VSGFGFIVYRQDWYGHESGHPEPPVIETWFATRGEAEACKSRLRLQFPDTTTLLCIAPASKPRKAKGRR